MQNTLSYKNIEKRSRFKHYGISDLCFFYIRLFLIYLCFETPILNLLPSSFIAIIRYGIEAVGYLLLFFMLLSKNVKFFATKQIRAMLIFILFCLINILINQVEIRISILGLRWIIRYWFVFFISAKMKWTSERINTLFNLIKTIMIVEVVLAGLQFVAKDLVNDYLIPRYESPIEGITVYATQAETKYALYASFGRYGEFGYFVMLALWIWTAEYLCAFNKKEKRKPIIMIVIWLMLLILSYCRQGVLALIISVLFFVLSYKDFKLSRNQTILIVVTIFLSIIVGTPFLFDFQMGKGTIYEGVAQRFLSIFSTDFIMSDFYGKGRTWFYTVGLMRLLSNKPLIGFGVGMYGCATAITYNSSVHSLLNIPTRLSMDVYYVSIIGQIGLVGCFLLLRIYFLFLKMCRNNFNNISMKSNSEVLLRKKIFIITFGYIICGLITGFFSSSLSDRYLAYYLWLLMGMCSSISNRKI